MRSSILVGQTAVITGGASGIGAAISQAFVDAGAAVVLLDRDAATGEGLAGALAPRGAARFIQCDMGDPDQVAGSLATVLRDTELDCLVNNVGQHPPHTPIDDISVEAFEALLRINVTSCFTASKHALPSLRRTQGSIVNIGSIVSDIGQQGAVPYVASKAAIVGLTKAMAIDEAHRGVRVNVVLPGVVDTASHQQFLDSHAERDAISERVSNWQWLRRIAEPEEVAATCVFVASRHAGFVTGAAIPVTGGAELGYGIKPQTMS
jgi:L-fucose dehydrogenase